MQNSGTNGLVEYRNNSPAISSYLRLGRVVKYTKWTSEDVQKFICEIDAEFDVFNKNMTLYRGLDNFYEVFDKSLDLIEEGDIITDNSYVSTSTEKHVAEQFKSRGGKLMIIDFNSCQKAIDMDGIGDSYHDYQKEILLPRGLRFLVTCVTDNEIYVKYL